MLKQRAPAGRADPLEVVEDRLEAARLATLPVKAEGEAMRLVADPLQQLETRVVPREQTGSRRPGMNTSSMRFASAITATRGRSYACIAARAAESWPCAVDHDEVRRRCERGVVRLPVPSESRAKRRAITSAIAAKSSGSAPAVLTPNFR